MQPESETPDQHWSLRTKPVVTADFNVEQAVPFFWVRDLQESLRFYVDGLGFTKSLEWIDAGRLRWCWVKLGGAAVMLQELVPDRMHEAGSSSNSKGRCHIFFICKDALSLYREFKLRGIHATRPVVGNAMWVTEVADPDGNQLLFESPTDVAEDTVLAE